MRKLLIAIILIISLNACCFYDSNYMQENTAVINDSQTENVKNGLYDIPKGLSSKYEKADFDKYNSPASENGLGGQMIWIEGIQSPLEKLTLKTGGTIYCSVFNSDGNEWIVVLDESPFMGEGDIDTYENMVGHTVAVFGSYQGFSNVYEMPSLHAITIYDRETGTKMTSGFGTYAYPDESKGTSDNIQNTSNADESSIPESEQVNEDESQTESLEAEWNNAPVVNCTDIWGGGYANQDVIIENCAVDNYDNSGTREKYTLWYPADTGYVEYDNISDIDSECFTDGIENGSILSVLIHIYDDNTFGSSGIKDIKVTGSIALDEIYESYKANCEPIDYEAIVKDPKGNKHERITLSGEIYFVESESDYGHNKYIVITNDGFVKVNYERKPETRFIKGDQVTVYGYCSGGLQDIPFALDKVPDVWSNMIISS